MPNRLIESNSPYLLQHAENPVDWRPWGPEPLAAAKAQEKPIFLSIGYSACHWCHVMAHESFEDPEIARLLNRDFIAIKVDREEHPELDQVYMEAVQMLTGHGGWPLSVFLTPDLEPFFGGTYWPPRPRGGMPGFGQVLVAVSDAWKDRRQQAVEQANALTGWLRGTGDEGRGAGGANLVPHPSPLAPHHIEGACAAMARAFDPVYGGFGPAPKFPQPTALRLLLQCWRRNGDEDLLAMVTTTLDRMAAGGIYDHLGGGFHRYSTDERWLVPHFEKMLYDNALLARCYLDAYQAMGDGWRGAGGGGRENHGGGTRNEGEMTSAGRSSVTSHRSPHATRHPPPATNPREAYPRVARQTLDYVLRDMTDPAGGFYSSEDADSEGHEGFFYLWTLKEIRAVLGSEAARSFAYVYDVTEAGNFEGHTILNLAKTMGGTGVSPALPTNTGKMPVPPADDLAAELAESRQRLLEVRGSRVRPGRDDKVLASWNGLMIDALAQAGAVLGEPRYADAAARAAEFILSPQGLRPEVVSCQLSGRQTDNWHDHPADGARTDNYPRGRLRHCWRRGRAEIDALLEDYASLANALVTLYEVRHEERWINEAVQLADEILARFTDHEHGGFFTAGADHGSLIVRKKDLLDASVPSGGGLATMALLRLSRLRDREDYLSAAEAALRAAAGLMEQAPLATGQMLLALDSYLSPVPPACDDASCGVAHR